MDEQWSAFIKTRLSDPGVNQAMEEFLFGISYEQITRLKNILREKGIAAIGRDEVSNFLGTDVKTNMSEDYRDFFQQYSLRRDNARARKRLDLQGPHKTLEDYFISFVMEQNRKKQENDSAVLDSEEKKLQENAQIAVVNAWKIYPEIIASHAHLRR